MFDTIHLEPNMVPPALRGAYKGNKFQARVCTEMTIPADAGLWSGGSRDIYTAIDFESGRTVRFPGQHLAPWENRQEHTVQLRPGFAVVCHTIFCGKDMGLRFYLHPENAARLLPPPVELTEHERLVLNATAGLKSHYNGRDRYQMATDNLRWDRKPYPSREQWDAAKAALIARGLLNKAGAITVAGKNATRR